VVPAALSLLLESNFAGFKIGQSLRQHGNGRPQLRHIGAFGKPVLDAFLALKDTQLCVCDLRVHIADLSSNGLVGWSRHSTV